MKFRYDTNLIKDMSVKAIASKAIEVEKMGLSNMRDVEVAASCVYVWKSLKNLRFTEEATNYSLENVLEYIEQARINFSIIHRVNYLLYDSMLDVLELVEDRGKCINGFKRNRKFVDNTFEEYHRAHKKVLSSEVFVMFQDYMRKANDVVTPYIKGLEEKSLNYMVFHKNEWKGKQLDDIELLVKIQTVLMFERVRKHSFVQFFKELIEKYGIDVSMEFRYAELSKMSMFFRDVCTGLGVKLRKDEHGDYLLEGIDIEKSSVYMSYWEKVINIIRDEDLLDKASLEAIEQNEPIRVKYEKELEAIEREQMEEEMSKLSEKYKVSMS